MKVKQISTKEACDFLLPRHYSGRKPQVSLAFGWFADNNLKAVCTFGKPASPSLCTGIFGGEYSSNVYELNRLCRDEDLTLPLSMFVGACLQKIKDWVVVSYADTGMHHNGYIYQACNFLYTGVTKQRTDKYTEGNKHSRHYNNDTQNGLRKVRTAKHRYIYLATKNKKLKRLWISLLQYPIVPYPKNENRNYILGEYQKPIIIRS